tara:strand:- start:318 stop:494 length:177 start_codon:yes stop_codon:yes gene_type:complete
MRIEESQWNVVKEVLYDYLDQNDHREDIRDILLKMSDLQTGEPKNQYGLNLNQINVAD